MAERSGAVTDYTPPQEGKNQAKFRVGGKVVRVWVKGYESENESEEFAALKAAYDHGALVTVQGKEEDWQTPAGKTIKMFTAQSVTGANQTAQNGHSAPQTPSVDWKAKDAVIGVSWAAGLLGKLAAAGMTKEQIRDFLYNPESPLTLVPDVLLRRDSFVAAELSDQAPKGEES